MPVDGVEPKLSMFQSNPEPYVFQQFESPNVVVGVWPSTLSKNGTPLTLHKTVKLYGPEKRNMPIFSFNIKGVHHYDLDTLLSQKNIMVRSGELCSQGMMRYLNIDGCTRASLAFYNSFEEIDRFVGAIKECVLFLRK